MIFDPNAGDPRIPAPRECRGRVERVITRANAILSAYGVSVHWGSLATALDRRHRPIGKAAILAARLTLSVMLARTTGITLHLSGTRFLRFDFGRADRVDPLILARGLARFLELHTPYMKIWVAYRLNHFENQDFTLAMDCVVNLVPTYLRPFAETLKVYADPYSERWYPDGALARVIVSEQLGIQVLVERTPDEAVICATLDPDLAWGRAIVHWEQAKATGALVRIIGDPAFRFYPSTLKQLIDTGADGFTSILVHRYHVEQAGIVMETDAVCEDLGFGGRDFVPAHELIEHMRRFRATTALHDGWRIRSAIVVAVVETLASRVPLV